eukprot:scaffold818_cov136-Cylindrotheca_fusiformis.AAC.15
MSSAKEDGLGDQMEAVLQLMTKRSQGKASNSQVQDAVSDILKAMGAASPAETETRSEPTKESSIKVDTDDYDNISDSETRPVASRIKTTNSDSQEDENDEEELYQDRISLIPMGKDGAKMMTTFGDGPKPIPGALEAALLGTRKTLHVAIMDARAIRRRTKKAFDQGRKMQRTLDKTSLADANSLDPTMMYRTLTSHDSLSYSPPCGFEMEQLECLYPEIMREYKKWNEMYKKSQRKDEEAAAAAGKDESKVVDTTENDEKEEDTEALGGHLKERAAHFDARTDQMKSDGYLKFSQVRQGSFLPRGKRQRKSKEDIQWEKGKKTKRGRQNDWESMDANTVRFLHWLGFSPTTISPPNDATTQALAFLGYDIMGRIVEKVRELILVLRAGQVITNLYLVSKAIFLRNLDSSSWKQTARAESIELWELKPGEQLSQKEVETALRDPEIQPNPIHSTDGSSRPSFQRYFGPGFEERLELEMEE